jgi:hypothetical protein
LVDISNVALLYRLRQSGDWFRVLIGRALSAGAPAPSRGRLIRIVDGTSVAQAGPAARKGNKLWPSTAPSTFPMSASATSS